MGRDDHSAPLIVRLLLWLPLTQGHSGCGGAAASIKAARGEVHIDKLTSPLFQFLVPLVRLARELGLGEEFDDMSNKYRLKLLIEENVRRQVRNIVNSETKTQ